MTSESHSTPGALTLYNELVLEGRAPNVERFCSHFPEEPGLPRRIRALEKLRADLGALVGRPAGQDRDPPEVVGGFKPLRLLASGGMGRVFLAEQLSPKRLCALKLLESTSPMSMERFQREADLAARLSHPSIATVYAFGIEDGVGYLAAELVHGFTLRDLLSAADLVTVDSAGDWIDDALRRVAEGGPRRTGASRSGPVATSVELAIQVAKALGHAHEQGVVHRDVKPSNIMVTFEGTAKLIDFGIAVPSDWQDDRMTRTGVFVGSHAYAAPEQLRGEHTAVGPWTDTYALGATLFEMLTQRTPFEAPTLIDRLTLTDQAPDRGPQSYNPQVPRMLDALVRRALDPNPERRFHDGNELAEALLQCPTQKPWLPGLSLHRWRSFARTRPSQLIAVASLCVALLLGALYANGVRTLEKVRQRAKWDRQASAHELLGAMLRANEKGAEPLRSANLALGYCVVVSWGAGEVC